MNNAERALMEVSKELRDNGTYRKDHALNIAAARLTGISENPVEIERLIGDPVNPNNRKLYDKYCNNFDEVMRANDRLI